MNKVFADGDVSCWVDENGTVSLKAARTFGEPVELTADEAREIAEALLELAEKLDE